jgi:hypothetical protein
VLERLRSRLRSERGESFAELIVSAALLGLLGVGMLTALSTTIIVSNADRSFAGTETVLRSYATALERRPYKTCTAGSSTNPYSAADTAFTAPTNYTTSLVSVKFLVSDDDKDVTASDFVTTCPAAGDQGAQMFTIRAVRTDGTAGQNSTVILRKGDTS